MGKKAKLSIFVITVGGLVTVLALTAAKLEKEGKLKESLPDLCASVQEAIVDALVAKMFLAIRAHKCRSLAIVGGVAANSRLRERLEQEWRKENLLLAPLVQPVGQHQARRLVGGVGDHVARSRGGRIQLSLRRSRDAVGAGAAGQPARSAAACRRDGSARRAPRAAVA